jgi:dienelactone hydrolase
MKTQLLEYDDGPTTLRGFLAYDDTSRAARPGVVLMPEVWGLGDNARTRAQRLAALGYVVLAADPYGDGVEFDSIQEAMARAKPLREDVVQMRRRIRVALDALAKHPAVDARRLAAIGYCMGGTFALELARSGGPIRGVVTFHAGLTTTRPAQAGEATAKVLVCTGADDAHIPLEQVKAFVDEMRTAGVDYQVNVYGAAKHGFAIPEADSRSLPGLGYNAAADARSWAAMLHFFDEIFASASFGGA